MFEFISVFVSANISLESCILLAREIDESLENKRIDWLKSVNAI